MSHIEVTERAISADCREIRVAGELDLAVVARLEEAIAGCRGCRTLIDLRDCQFIDSTGIAVIVRAHREWAGDGDRLVVHSPSDQVLRVFDVTGLVGTDLVFGSREEALGDAMESETDPPEKIGA